jgi:uncharacterized protein YkwD
LPVFPSEDFSGENPVIVIQKMKVKQMRKIAAPVLLLLLIALLAPELARSSSPLPPYPSNKRSVRPDASERQKAQDLYQLTKRENRKLHWDPCLARKAFMRAKQLVTQGYFDHKDPRTGKNPAWELVSHCFPYRAAGENLAKGIDTPENIHKALMASSTHRKNIMDPRFERIGVACYDYVCVELFAGF